MIIQGTQIPRYAGGGPYFVQNPAGDLVGIKQITRQGELARPPRYIDEVEQLFRFCFQSVNAGVNVVQSCQAVAQFCDESCRVSSREALIEHSLVVGVTGKQAPRNKQ